MFLAIGLPTGTEGWIYGVLISLVFGVLVGAIVKHAFKFLALLGIIVVIMVAMGYISTAFFNSLAQIAGPEIAAFQKDPYFFSIGQGLVFLVGIVLAIKWL